MPLLGWWILGRKLPSTVISLLLEVRKSGWKWKVIAPVLGVFGFGAAGTVIGNQINPQGFIISDGAATGGVVGASTGLGAGLVVGWLADRHYVKIDIAR